MGMLWPDCPQDWNKVVGQALGPKYAQISSHSLGKIALVVFVRLKLQQHISDVQTSSVATGRRLGYQLCCRCITLWTVDAVRDALPQCFCCSASKCTLIVELVQLV